MKIPAARWHSAIAKRRSRRQFNGTLLTREHIKRMHSVCKNFRPFDGVHAELIEESPDSILKGIIGSYGVIKGASTFLAFVGNARNPFVHEQVGYTGEGIILEAESLRLNTCWVGGNFRPDVVASHIDIARGETVFAVAPIGYAERKTTFTEKLVSGFGWTHRRKQLPHLVHGLNKKEWPDWMESSLEAARLAPSAFNRQPWRFLSDSHSITVAVDGRNVRREETMSKRLDCGVAMLHIELGALVNGAKGEWEFINPPGVARFTVSDQNKQSAKRNISGG